MTLRVRAARAVLALAFVAPAANGVSAQPAASATCDQAVRSHQTLQELLGFVERLKDARPIWTSYRPASASYVLLVPGPDEGRCAAIWRDGAVRAVVRMTAAPRLDTPLYGFYRPTKPEDQPSELREQLQAAGVREAVILPLDGDARLKLSMSSRAWFIDMAVHEAFHLLVQFPARAARGTAAFSWPAWTLPQPDRAALATRCYGSANPKEQRLAPERAALFSAAAAALTDGALENVCHDTKSFIAERRRRWTELASVDVPAEDGTASLTCAKGEAVMELNEGVPSFVAWLTARQLAIVDDERLRLQFGAQQRDVFYTTGMMQLTVLRRLAGNRFAALTERLGASSSPAAADIFSTLEAEASRTCP